MYYFAYGSNMEPKQMMEERCPNAKFVAKALLPKYRLAFPRYSQTNNCWVASIENAAEHETWGVVYEISDRNEIKAEGYAPDRPLGQNAYNVERCTVLIDGKRETPLEAETYVANDEGYPPDASQHLKAPNKQYKALLVNGAQHWKLPPTYVQQLQAIETLD